MISEKGILLKENERIDDLERNGYRIIQDTHRFCFGMDAVLLSGFARVKNGVFLSLIVLTYKYINI